MRPTRAFPISTSNSRSKCEVNYIESVFPSLIRASGVVEAIGLGVAVIAIAHPSGRSNAFCFSLDAAHATNHINYLSKRRQSRDAANSLVSTGLTLAIKLCYRPSAARSPTGIEMVSRHKGLAPCASAHGALFSCSSGGRLEGDMWPALNFAADSLEISSTSPPSAVNFEVLIADGTLLARRSRPPVAGAIRYRD